MNFGSVQLQNQKLLHRVQVLAAVQTSRLKRVEAHRRVKAHKSLASTQQSHYSSVYPHSCLALPNSGCVVCMAEELCALTLLSRDT